MEQLFLDQRVAVLVADITRERVDAIVNAANSSLMGGGGVDGAIHRAGGPAILAECREIRRTKYPGGLPTGEAVITTGGKLPANHVIHTVGPIYGQHGGKESALLTACYQRSLSLASSHQLSSVAFPAISTGIFGYPKDEAAAVSSRAIAEFLSGDQSVELVRLVFFNDADAKAFLAHHQFS